MPSERDKVLELFSRAKAMPNPLQPGRIDIVERDVLIGSAGPAVGIFGTPEEIEAAAWLVAAQNILDAITILQAKGCGHEKAIDYATQTFTP